jgi:hypothetical protein
MSRWRRVALEQVPSCKRDIEEAWSPMSMWIELHDSLENAYESDPPDEVVIREIYGYALWCWRKSKNDDLETAVACAFFEWRWRLANNRRWSPGRDWVSSP